MIAQKLYRRPTGFFFGKQPWHKKVSSYLVRGSGYFFHVKMIAPVHLISNWLLPPGGSGLKTLSKAQWLRYKPVQNVRLIPPQAGLRFFIGLRPRVGGMTLLIVLIKVCLLPLSLIYDFETTSRQKTLLVLGTMDVVCGRR